MQKNILFEASAVKETLEELRQNGYRWRGLNYINKKRYCIAYGEPTIAILLKTEPFYNFSKMFPKEKGAGDSINVEALKRFAASKVKWIYTKFRDGRLYKISLADVILKGHKWQQKEGTAVYSFSIHLYERVDKEMKT